MALTATFGVQFARYGFGLDDLDTSVGRAKSAHVAREISKNQHAGFGLLGAVMARGANRELLPRLPMAAALTDIAGPRIHMRPVSGFPLIHVEYRKFEGRKHFTKRKGDLVILFRTVKTVVMPALDP